MLTEEIILKVMHLSYFDIEKKANSQYLDGRQLRKITGHPAVEEQDTLEG